MDQHAPDQLAARTSARPAVGIEVAAHPAGALVARLTGQLDILGAPVLREWVRAQLARPEPLVLDLDGLDFLGVAGLLCLVDCATEAAGTGHPFALAAGTRPIRRLIVLAGLDARLAPHAGVDAAAAAIAGGGGVRAS